MALWPLGLGYIGKGLAGLIEIQINQEFYLLIASNAILFGKKISKIYTHLIV